MSVEIKGSEESVDNQSRSIAGAKPRFLVTFEHLAMVFVVLVGYVANAAPISQNTMLLHIRTGMDIFTSESIPRHDPYSFTSAGDPWVVQSWLAEWTYGALHALGGWHLVIFEQMFLTAAIALFVTLLARSGSMVRTVVPCIAAMTVGVAAWSTRPALFGTLFFAITVYVVDRKRSSWWLLPVGWLWVNTHGSFPLGVAWLMITAFGSWCDNRASWRKYIRPISVLTGGILLGAINPLGPKILTFSLRVFGARKVAFAHISEWNSPSFHAEYGFQLLAAIVIAVLVLTRFRSAWRYTLPFTAFLAASLYSERNVALLAVVLVPAMRYALSTEDISPKVSYASKRVIAMTALAMCFALAGSAVRVESSDAFDLKGYPVEAMQFAQRTGLLDAPHHVATQDFVGCYRNFTYGPNGQGFIDDRYDMYRTSVAQDYFNLLRGTADPNPILNKYGVDVVLWQKREPLVIDLENGGQWHSIYADHIWAVLVRN